MKDSTWTITYTHFEPAHEGLREALCTLGNGYFATRGAAPEGVISKIHYPGTYVAGVYNKLSTHLAGKVVVNEDLVNCPNWLYITFRVGEENWFIPSEANITSYHQELNMHEGILRRTLKFKDRQGRITQVFTERLVHMKYPHIGALRYLIIPLNYEGWITVRVMLDGAVENRGVERYRQLNSKHLRPSALGSFGKDGIYLAMVTSQSKIKIAQACRVSFFINGERARPAIKTVRRRLMEGRERIGQEFRFFARRGFSYEVQKIVSIYTSKDFFKKEPTKEAIKAVKEAPSFVSLVAQQRQIWQSLWERFDITIQEDKFSQWALRVHIFHLLQTASPNNVNLDVSIPARGLHGEAYRGHIFWDEVFIMHFYDLHYPQISKAFLLYRYRRLKKARQLAKKFGYKGAMYPWQSASTGDEETQMYHLNPLSGKWGPDYSSYQRHISFAVAYNVWKHWERTLDFQFLTHFGAEMILSIAQFGASLVSYSKKDKRYHTERVMGPDEFHEKYPHATQPGLRDNAYTNFMIVWTLSKAKEVIKLLPYSFKNRLIKKLGITSKDLKLWDDITRKMKIVINRRAIIAQFDGYFDLKELDWKKYLFEYGDVKRMDRILRAEGKTPDEYKVTKQADVLMIFYLFSLQEIKKIFNKLGYKFDFGMVRKNYEYYSRRTSHGSTLSKVVHCFVAHSLGKKEEAWDWFIDTLESDIYDTQRGTTSEGIHTGVMGGSIDIVMRAFAGLSVGDSIKINPSLPKKWKKLTLKFLYRNLWFTLSIRDKTFTLSLDKESKPSTSVDIVVGNKVYKFPLGKRATFSIKGKYKK
ncbi:MAG: glycoside hydrolase family 65 protein [Candidatus Omnitrophica bacterium]|nr:glycoside hydrolase family 65 protein [Candidatus Omnitrophota bacterium]